VKVFYHADLDGECSAAIVAYAGYTRADFIEVNYDRDFPIDHVEDDEDVVIVDFSTDAFGELLRRTSNVTWIDHHVSALSKYKDYSNLQGIRDGAKAACELTWQYYFHGKVLPRVVELIADYDTWTFKHGEITRQVHEGMLLYDTRPLSGCWSRWFVDGVREIRHDGEIALKYRERLNAMVAKNAYHIVWEGYDCICCNSPLYGSNLFDSTDGGDILIVYRYGNGKWTVSLYAGHSDVDVSQIAMRYGGGGHRGAAGFTCDNIDFLSGGR